MRTSKSKVAPIGGLSVEQYAGVMAATGDLIPLVEVLAQEQIPIAQWAAAERGWRIAIAQSTVTLIEYTRVRRDAEDCLWREVEPVDRDPVAWMGLLERMSNDVDLGTTMMTLGISMADVSRLSRYWRRQAAKDAKIATQLETVGASRVSPTKLKVGPMVLRPFPWTPPKVATPTEGTDESASGSHGKAPRRPQQASYQIIQAQAAERPFEAAVDLEQARLAVLRNAVPDETAFLPSPFASAPAMPFLGVDAEARGLSLARYAAIRAALERPGAGIRQVLAQWSLTPTDYEPIDNHYRTKLSAKKDWRDEFERCKAQAREAIAAREREVPATPEISVQQYAWIVATLECASEEMFPATLDRLRLTQASRRALDSKWRRRLDRDPELARAFADHLSKYSPRRRGAGRPLSAAEVGETALMSSSQAAEAARASATPFGGAVPAARDTLASTSTEDDGDSSIPTLLMPTPIRTAAADQGQSAAAKTLPDTVLFSDVPDSTLLSEPVPQPQLTAGRPVLADELIASALTSLTEYVRISAMLTLDSDPEATFRRLGIDSSRWMSVVISYSRKFARDPALRDEFDQRMTSALSVR